MFYSVQLDMRGEAEGDDGFRMRYVDPSDASVVGPWSDISAVILYRAL